MFGASLERKPVIVCIEASMNRRLVLTLEGRTTVPAGDFLLSALRRLLLDPVRTRSKLG
jgi:hypothetical protein